MTRYHDVIRQLNAHRLGTAAQDYRDACWMTNLHVNAITVPTSMKPVDAVHLAGKTDRGE